MLWATLQQKVQTDVSLTVRIRTITYLMTLRDVRLTVMMARSIFTATGHTIKVFIPPLVLIQ